MNPTASETANSKRQEPKAELRVCALCGARTDFIAHSSNLCLACGDAMQDPAGRQVIANLVERLRTRIFNVHDSVSSMADLAATVFEAAEKVGFGHPVGEKLFELSRTLALSAASALMEYREPNPQSKGGGA